MLRRPLVFESPVQSGFLTPRDLNRNRNRSMNILEPQKTGLDRCRPVFLGLDRFLDRSQSLTGFNRSFRYFCNGRKFLISLSFILSPRTSKLSDIQHRYEDFEKFYLLLPILDKIWNISVSFLSIYMFLGYI